MRRILPLCLPILLLGLTANPAMAEPSKPAPKAVDAANAADWKPAPEDATDALQAAIDSGASVVRVPNLGRPWIVRPIRLRSDLELIFEDGVEVVAKRGEFHGKQDSLFTAREARRLTLRGEGHVVLRMWKSDYQMAEYLPAEWRSGISLYGCEEILIENLTIRETGGDGIYLGVSGALAGCAKVTVRNVLCDANHRQGLSIISGRDLLIENCIFQNTRGTPPEAGLDVEPSRDGQFAERIVVRNCLSKNNAGPGFIGYFLKNTAAKTPPLDILFDRCRVLGNKGSAFVVGGVSDKGPKGTIRFVQCEADGVQEAGIYVYDKARTGAQVIFDQCALRAVGQADRPPNVSPEMAGKDVSEAVPIAPVVLFLRRDQITQSPGGVQFINCRVEDTGTRPVVVAASLAEHHPVRDIAGSIQTNLSAPRLELGAGAAGVSLELQPSR